MNIRPSGPGHSHKANLDATRDAARVFVTRRRLKKSYGGGNWLANCELTNVVAQPPYGTPLRPAAGAVNGEGAMSFQQLRIPGMYFGTQICPSCRELVFAAEGADVALNAITYRWTCDLCSHSFSTVATIQENAA